MFEFLLGKRLSMLFFILWCRMELTAYYRNITFHIHRLLSVRDMRHSLLPFDDAPQNISYRHDMRERSTYILDHFNEWQLTRYGSEVPRERLMWIEIYAHCLFL